MQPDERESLVATWRAEEGDQPAGWDFSALARRMSTDPTPWDLDGHYRRALRHSARVLDMGTGGGDHLLTFRHDLPADVTATEGWAPNVSIAREALSPFGIDVVEFSAPDDAPDSARMPFPDGRFDLVLNRHESYGPHEIARVLEPGGALLTQQVGSGELHELHALLGVAPPDQNVHLDRFAQEAAQAGLCVEESGSSEGCYRFDDVAALVAYLRLVPWEVPDDFSVDIYRTALLALHDRTPDGQQICLTRRRFWLRARKPRA